MLGKIVSPRLEKLEKEFLESGGEWKEYKVGDLFDIHPTKNYGLTNVKLFETIGETPVIVNSSLNNGVGGYVDLDPLEKKGIITFSDTTTADSIFYQPRDFIGYSHIQGMYPYDSENWTEKSMLYFCSTFKRSTQGLFDYANKFNREKAREILVALPFLNGKIYFSYMEKYIEELEAYLVATGLKNYHLTKYDEEVLDRFNKLSQNSSDRKTDRIDRFILENLFSAETGDVDLQQSDINDRGIYFINSGLQNNGIKGKTDKPAKIFPANTITVDFWGNAFYRNFDYKMATHNHVFSLSGASIKNEQVGLYLVSSMSYLSKIYSYNDMGTWNKMKKLEIEVPTLNNEIDYKFMKDFIYAIEKLVIKDVVIWADKKIEATKQVAGRN
ncbi:MAG: restriction endonuclease subunit S [Catonella sp.]|uniref:restriction endonuclease subunit S n=1 Tax=Catonella sp. TaxID=2382125 RepID=UPI003F9F686E